MRILVTGGTGRLGRSVVAELASEHDVVVFARDPASGPLAVPVIRGELADLGQVYGAMAGCEAVVHLAAIPSPGGVTADVVFRNNVIAAHNVAEAAMTLGVRTIVYSSSGSAYGFAYGTRPMIPSYLPIDEEHPLLPQDPYGLSKWFGEEIFAAATRRTGLRTIVFRPPTVLTPESYAEQVPRMLDSSGRRSLFAYVDARDFAQAVRLALADESIVHDRFIIAADDALSREPLCDVFPRFYPGSERVAAALTGTQSSVTSARAKRLLGYQPHYRWRDLVPPAG